MKYGKQLFVYKLGKSNKVIIVVRKSKKLIKDTNPKYNQSRNEKVEKIEI